MVTIGIYHMFYASATQSLLPPSLNTRGQRAPPRKLQGGSNHCGMRGWGGLKKLFSLSLAPSEYTHASSARLSYHIYNLNYGLYFDHIREELSCQR